MVKRRKMLIGMGALAAGSAAGVGTGAFTSASIPDRQVSVQVEQDDESTIALVPGSDPDITISSNPGELELDLTGDDGEGSNINSVYTWGDPTDPANSHAFKLVNNDESAYDDVVASYELEDASWVDNSTTYSDESKIVFNAFGSGDPDGYWGSVECPNNALGTPNPVSRELGTSNAIDLEPGQELYFVVTVDTTGSLATLDDDLSGSLSFDVS